MGNSKGIVKRYIIWVNRRGEVSHELIYKDGGNMSRFKEEWKPLEVENIKPIYLISSYGNVKNKNTDKYIKPWTDKDGYLKYTLQGYDKKVKKYAHVLVALHFVHNEFPKTRIQVNHKNFKKNDNYYRNLEWVTQKENIYHARKHNVQKVVRCSEHGMATMTDEYVEHICQMMQDGYTNREIIISLGYEPKTREYELMRGKIKMIRSGKSWKAISQKYNI